MTSGQLVVGSDEQCSLPGNRCHDVKSLVIDDTCWGWLESRAPASYSERQLEELDRLIEPWLDDYERTSRAARK